MHKKTILHWLWEVLNDLIGHSYFCDLKNKQYICSPASRRGRDRGEQSKFMETMKLPSQHISF